jgi:O-antigen ligase
MRKNNSLINTLTDKNHIALVCILAMFIGFLCAPALNSIAIIVFGANALRDINPKKWFRVSWWWLSVLWVAVYALSYFWSEDKGYWATRLQVKLPLLIMPLAFCFLPPFRPSHLRIITFIINITLLVGAAYSISFLIRDFDYYMAEYRYSHLFPTPVRGDHIRFSLAIALCILWSWKVFPTLEFRWLKIFTMVSMVLLTVYLHVLAAKSGLIALYFFLACWCIYYTVAQRKIWGILTLAFLCAAGVAAVQLVPTLHRRFEYTMLNYQILKNKDRVAVYGDVNRIISYKLAWNLIMENPMKGVGVGDMEHEMRARYDRFYPETTDENRLLPHDQFLVAGLGAGFPAMIALALWALFPLTALRRNRDSFFFGVTWAILLFQLLIEPVLEVHFGVFVFLFFMLLLWHTIPGRSPEENGMTVRS